MLKRWTAFTRFLSDGRICLTNNAAECALRGTVVVHKNSSRFPPSRFFDACLRASPRAGAWQASENP
jgi:hypothetical protein